MATFKLDLTTSPAVFPATFTAADTAVITLDPGTGVAVPLNTIAGVTTTGGVISIPNVGTLTLTALNSVTFKAASAFTGELDLTKTGAGTNVFTNVDLSSATGPVSMTAAEVGGTVTAITGGAGADSIIGGATTATLSGGAGDDVLSGAAVTSFDGGTGNDTISVTATATVAGGAGADKFVQLGTNKLTVTDYRYSQGDTLKQKQAFTAYGTATAGNLSSTGLYSDTTGVAAIAASVDADANHIYKIKVEDSTAGPARKEFWTAAAETVTLDGSASTNALQIDASAATKAVVTGSSYNDTIKLGANPETLVAGVNGGHDTIDGFVGGFSGDVLNLSGVTLNDVSWGKTATGAAVIGTTTTIDGTNGAFSTTTEGKILVQENGGAIKKVVFSADANKTVTWVDAADVYMATGDAATVAGARTTLDASAVTVDATAINLQDTNKYRNIRAIKGATAATASYVGLADTATGTLFNLAAATKASEVWGGSKATDSVTLMGTNGVQDVMWFGSTDGKDTVQGFKAGFAATSDVVNLYNVANVSNLDFAVGLTSATDGVKITAATNNWLDLTTTAALNVNNSVQLKLKDSAGTVKKVAVAIDSLAASVIDGVGADLVIGTANAGDTVTYGAAQTANVVVNLLDTAVYKNIENVNLTGAAGSYNVVVGSGSKSSLITLAGATAEAWGGSKDADTFNLGSGTDTIWYGANDGGDTVNQFTVGTDKIKFYDKTVGALVAAYTWDGVSKFASTTKAADSLTFGATIPLNKTIDILDKDNKAAKVALAAVASDLTYVKGTDIYMGSGATKINVTSSENVVLYLGNGVDATVNDIYFSGVNQINAATATGQTVLIGSAAAKDTLIGGTTSSAMWGGGSTADTMTGGVGTDQYWFGAGDGADVVDAGVDKKDTIVLHNVASIADVTMAVDFAGNKFSVTAADGSKLTVTDTSLAALDGGLTFQFGVNEAAKNYSYDRIAGTFIAK